MRRIPMIAVSVALCASAVRGGPAAADHPSGSKLGAWASLADVGAVGSSDGFRCEMNFRVVAIERGKHGVQQFKFRPRIYLGDIGYAPEWINSWARGIRFDGGWSYSPAFPNDSRSFYVGFTRNWAFDMRDSYSLVVRAVGVRPSWWQSDLKVDVPVGVCRMSTVEFGS